MSTRNQANHETAFGDSHVNYDQRGSRQEYVK